MRLAAILLGVYLLAIVMHGQSNNLLVQAKAGKGYFKWLAAVVLLWWLDGFDELKPAMPYIVTGAVIVFVMNNLTTIQSQVKTVWGRI